MDIQLAEILFEKQLFNKGMEVEAKYDTYSLGNISTIGTVGEFMIQDISKLNGKLIFTTASTDDGKIRLFESCHIIGIDGMTPIRFAAVYGLMPNGSLRRQGKKRGRKPKIR